jgi:hypothetical protein
MKTKEMVCRMADDFNGLDEGKKNSYIKAETFGDEK